MFDAEALLEDGAAAGAFQVHVPSAQRVDCASFEFSLRLLLSGQDGRALIAVRGRWDAAQAYAEHLVGHLRACLLWRKERLGPVLLPGLVA